MTSGKALKNLKDQYGLLSKQNIEVKQDEKIFSVTIPIIN